AQELFLTGLTALVAELAVRECKLLIHLCVLNRVRQALSHAADLFAASLAIAQFFIIFMSYLPTDVVMPKARVVRKTSS
ncbi:hypothetical protein, partial [Marinobacterium halophilum]|uniref:hypothetical protein n=1 Tax=Marinobacterium halophilum TaxID=267374 RepID=UPI001B805A57